MERGIIKSLISTFDKNVFGYESLKRFGFRRAAGGFTIVEMVMSIAVIGFVSMLTLPALMAQMAGYDIEKGAKEISSVLVMARVRSIETQMPHRVKFDLNSNPQRFIIQQGTTSRGVTTWVDDVTIKEMKEDIVISRVDDVKGKGKSSGIGSIEFSPVGKPTRGVVYLEDSKGERYTVALNVATGKVAKTKGW